MNCCSFAGLSVLLFVEDGKRDGFKRMLEAGGAIVRIGKVSGNDLRVWFSCGCWYRSDPVLQDITHAVVSPDAPPEPATIRALQNSRIPCVLVDFVVAWLSGDQPPDIADHAFP